MTNPRLRIPADVAMQMDPRNTPYNPKQVYEDPWAMLEVMQEPIPPGSGTCPTDPPMNIHPVTALNHQIGGDHYTNMAIQPVEFFIANNIPFVEGAIIKYVCRYKQKNGVEDLKKARHFIDILIESQNNAV